MNRTIIVIVAICLAVAAVFLQPTTSDIPKDEGIDPEMGPLQDAERDITPGTDAEQRLLYSSDVQVENLDELADPTMNVGEKKDPDDPESWSSANDNIRQNIGEKLDPDDPTSWPDPNTGITQNAGPALDPDDPDSWPSSIESSRVDIGASRDPDNPDSWEDFEEVPRTNKDARKDPDNPDSWLD